MKVINRLSIIQYKSKMNKNWKHSNLFQILSKDEIWLTSYETLTSSNIYIRPRILNENLNIISLKRLKVLREEVIYKNYHFKMLNNIHHLKLENQKKLLPFYTANDKIIQDVIRTVFLSIYQYWFLKQSFRVNQVLGTHDILGYIELKFQFVNWILGRIKLDFNNKQFYKILIEKIKDIKLIKLIVKLIKCETIQQKLYKLSSFYIPQKSIISLIFINIYYSKFDEWIQKKLKKIYYLYIARQNKNFKKFSYQIYKMIYQLKILDKKLKMYKILLKTLRIIKNKRIKIKTLITKNVQIKYIRYYNNSIIAINGNRILVKQLQMEINLFLLIKLNQKIYPIKTKIIDLSVNKANFLGYQLYVRQNQKIKFYITSKTRIINKTNFQLEFDIPIDSVLKKLEKKGYIKKFFTDYHSISKANCTILDDNTIIENFRQIWKELINYYSGCTNFSKLLFINYLLRLSCSMTLNQKHNSTLKKSITRYRKILNVSKINVKDIVLSKKKWQNKLHFIDPFNIFLNKISFF